MQNTLRNIYSGYSSVYRNVFAAIYMLCVAGR